FEFLLPLFVGSIPLRSVIPVPHGRVGNTSRPCRSGDSTVFLHGRYSFVAFLTFSHRLSLCLRYSRHSSSANAAATCAFSCWPRRRYIKAVSCAASMSRYVSLSIHCVLRKCHYFDEKLRPA